MDMRKRGGISNMTNEIGTTLSDIEAKAKMKDKVKYSLVLLYTSSQMDTNNAYAHYQIIRKYIEEN